MESQSDPTSSQIGDAESNMRRNLGLDGTPPSSANDPLKAVRQAIRSQTAAREYAEQQLAQAQGAIQDLRSRLHHSRQEKDAAIVAAHSAIAAKDTAERSARGAESALINERANRARTEGMLRDAQATILDLREKLATANQTLHTAQAELSAERSSQMAEDDGVIVVPEVAAPIAREEGLPVVKRPVGRPRKVVAETAQALVKPPTNALAMSQDDAVPPIADDIAPTVRRPVGRPRKIIVAEPSQTVKTPPKKAQVYGKANKPRQKVSGRGVDDQEPVRWWIDGWKEL